MPRIDTTAKLTKMMSKLVAERKKNLDKIARLQAKVDQVDAIFSGLGISLQGNDGAPRRGRKPGRRGPKPGRRRGRGSFPISGEESVLAFIKKHGNPSTSEVNEHWHGEGRGGKADNTLSKLVKVKQLKRVSADDARGSRYVLA